MPNGSFGERSRGASLLELVLVIALLGVLATIGTVTLRSSPGGYPSQDVARLEADLLAAQWMGISRGQRMELRFTASDYAVHACTSAGCGGAPLATLPTGALAHALPPGATLESSLGPMPQTLQIDALGRPLSAAGALLTSSVSFSVLAGGRSASLNLSPVTGYVSR